MKKNKKNLGFTLVELLIVIVLMGIISVVIGRILFQSLQTFVTSQNISESDWRGLLIMNVFANDVHTVRSANDISTISATSFSFTNMAGTTVTYQLNGTTLQRNGFPLANNVNSVSFAYYDKNYSTTAVAANVRYISLATTVFQNNLSQSFSTLAGTRGMS